jgi:hypothetical protein
MTTMQRDPLVDDYLRRLDASAAGLPHERRRELVAEIDEHIEAALAEHEAADETTVRNVLERLGPPEEIAAAAEPSPPQPTRGRLETTALIVLSASFLVPFAGYLIGAVLVVSSGAWAARDKLIGLLIPPAVVLLGGGLIVAVAARPNEGGGGGLGPTEITVLIADLLSGVLAAAYLAWRLRPSPVA